MFNWRDQLNDKYFRIEVGFFVFISYISSIISDIEYSIYEEHHASKFINSLEYRMVFGTFALAMYLIYYYGFLKGYVFGKKTLAVVISMAVFLVTQRWTFEFAANWLVSKMPFVSHHLQASALKSLQSARLRFTINYALISDVFPLIGFTFVIRSLQQEEHMKTLKEQQLVTELNYLKAQLHPHFFFNTMNNIYSLALQQSKDTPQVVSRLADMMRYILYEADQQKVPLTREAVFLTNYVAVEKIRHHNNQICVDMQGITDNVMIQPLILLPFIENAFKHGLEQETQQGFVNVLLCMAEDELILEVTNSIPVKSMITTKGIGLQNVIKRLDILYPGKHILQVIEESDKYQVSLTLQMA